MTDLLIPLSTGLHVLATIVFVGYYFLTGLIYLTVLERCLNPSALRDALERASARLRPFFGGSLLVFVVTGTYLMVINQSYQGLGNFLANPWSTLIVVKHVLVLAFLVIAVGSERLFMGQISERKPQALQQFHRALNANALLGVVIVLMTAFAQGS
jgi:uncharacterized membrane protein